jgi:aldehyde oxidoreductase
MKNITLTINGAKKQISVNENKVLLDLLREDLNLTGTKQSCDRKGQCGACTVIVDGKAVRSCLKKVVDLEGTDVITVEGLGTPENPHLIQEAFVLAGAVQCGFCTPGMIMATKALLDQNPVPDNAAIKKALARNLCRCTGYVKIIDAVKLAGKFLRKETTPEKIRAAFDKKKMIGESHPRPTAMIKACGLAKFTADIKLDNMLELAVVLSTEHHAKIKSIDKSSAEKMPGVVGVMTAEDIKGTNRTRMVAADQCILCEDIAKTLGDPVAIVAAETREQARTGAAAVKVEYEPLPVMMTPAESLAEGAYQIHTHSPNLLSSQPLIRGNVDKALAQSAAWVEADFSTQMNHQAPLEPEVSCAYLEGEGRDAKLVVIGRSIWIHEHANELKEALGWDNIHYREAYVGGQFGIKLHITTEGIAAAAALHFKRPAKIVPSLTESMLISSKRHPCDIHIKLGADSDGHLTAIAGELTYDKGAYTLIGAEVPARALHMLFGPYNIPNVNVLAKLAYTNNASGGAARGAGPPQANYALECAMDMLAEKLNIDPLEFRKLNSLKPGQRWSTGPIVEEWPFPELCDAIRPNYERAKKEAAAFKGGAIKRGVGLGCHSFGIGDPFDASELSVEMDPDNGITIYAAVADPGEGNDSMLTQIAAHVLEIPMDKIRLYTRDTDKTVQAGASAGSRMTYMAGGALVDALEKIKQAMKEAGTKTYAGLKQAEKPTRFAGAKNVKSEKTLDPKTGQGDTFDSQTHNIQMAEVEVNTESSEVKVLKMTSAVDAGPIINPQSFEGQNEGGMDQGVGWALREEYIHGKSKDWITFKFPTIEDSFDVEYVTRETPRKRGPLGSTGIGEMTMTSTAPAVINAIHHACGIWIHDLPATPAKIKSALAELKK